MKFVHLFYTFLLILLLHSLPAISGEESSGSVCGKYIALKDCPIIAPPQTAIDLLNNIKNAVTLDLLFDDDLFNNDEKLWQFFGGRQFSKYYPFGDNIKSMGITNFPVSMYKPLKYPKPKGSVFETNIGLRKYTYGDANITINFSLTFASNLEIGFSEIEEIFGKTWKPYHVDITTGSEYFGRAPSLPQGPHGYQKITYKWFDKNHSEVDVNVGFDQTGKFFSLEFNVIKNKKVGN